MYTVYLNSRDEGHGFQTFYEKFIAICNEHRKENRAMVFAFILYDFQNPQLAKVLKDTDYWLSLNDLSGKYMTVFSIHYKPIVRHKAGRGKDSESDSDGIIFTYSTFVTDYHNPSESTNLLIEKYFGKGVEVKYPSVLFFQTDSEKIIDYTIIELDEKEIEQSFLELKTYIEKAVEALKLITDENKGNIQEIFNNVGGSVKGVRTRRVAAQKVKKITSLAELGSSIVGLGG